jgi:uncharacterized protein (UPF0332 family)
MRIEDFFTIGESLFQQSAVDPIVEEIHLRTALNRLYYGLFHFVQRRLGILIPNDQKSRCHRFVKEAIEQFPFINDYSQIEELRNRSDYEITSSVRRDDYMNAERLKRRIITQIDGTEDISSEDDESYFNNFTRM